MRRLAAWLAMCLWVCPLVFAGEPSSVWLDVPFVKQEKNGCGAASVAMVMQYWQRELGQPSAEGADAAQIQRALYSREGRGIYAADLRQYFEQHGYRAFVYQGTWDDLQEQLAKGRPPIVVLKTGRDDLHYVVVAGVDRPQGLLLKNDPAERKLLKQSRASFEKEWKAAASWIVLAVPQQDGPTSSR